MLRLSGRAVCIAVMLGLCGAALSCSDEGSKSLCPERHDQLKSCGLLSSGVYPCSGPDSAWKACWSRCILEASCDEVERNYCGGGVSKSLEACWEDCEKLKPFCADGEEQYYEEYRCDGYEYCDDGSDEEGCKTFRCTDGSGTLAVAVKCNGDEDCDDGSDEEGCPKFDCEDGSKTIPIQDRCDRNGIEHCDDGSDEAGCPEIADIVCN